MDLPYLPALSQITVVEFSGWAEHMTIRVALATAAMIAGIASASAVEGFYGLRNGVLAADVIACKTVTDILPPLGTASTATIASPTARATRSSFHGSRPPTSRPSITRPDRASSFGLQPNTST